MADIPERKKLIEYLPPFMQSFREIQEIMEAEDKMVDDFDVKMAQLLDNAFISDCDEYGIQKYEKALGIFPGESDTLEERKARVLIRWNDYIPYTIRTLIQKLNEYCGVNNYDLELDLENYSLGVHIHLQKQDAIHEVEDILERIIPCNMYIQSFNELVRELDGVVYGAGTVVTHKMVTIS